MLKFNSDGKFTIMCFGDLHEKGDYAGAGKKRFADVMALHNAALDEFRPDLCVYMGDNTCAEGLDTPKGLASFTLSLEAITAPVRERNIPFTSIFGNHCHDFGNEDIQLKVYQSLDGCIMRNDAPDNVSGDAMSNELIYSHDGSSPVFNLWFLDSNNLCENEKISKYDWVHTDQIKWYEQTAEKLRSQYGRTIPAMLFQHIPVPEEYDLLRRAMPWEIPFSVSGCNLKSRHRYVMKNRADGYLGEGPCSPDFNNGQFASWKKEGDVIAAVFGHDHMNEFCGTVDGITLMQTQTAGFGAYTNGCRCGVRVITLYENDPWHFDTQLKHFKEFGLKSQCLGPVFRTITDRQSMALHFVKNTALCTAVSVAAAVGITELRRK